MPLNSNSKPTTTWIKCYGSTLRRRLPAKDKAHGPRQNREIKIRRRKPKRAADERIYNARVKVWLIGKVCVVFEAGRFPGYPAGTKVQATQCHHAAGRTGEFLMLEKFWVPVSFEGHGFIERNRKEAKARGWLLNRDRKAIEAQGLL